MLNLSKLNPSQKRLLSLTLLLVTVWATFLGLGFTKLWQKVEFKEFDLLTVMTAPRKSSLPITIIAIDEPSFAELALQWPWPRSLHARLVDRLSKAGAAVIAFDMVFSENSKPKEDQQFAKSIRKAGNVILAADQAYQETSYTRQWVRVEPLMAFRKSGAVAGLATISLDSDMVIRQVPESQEAFWRQVIASFQKARPGMLTGDFNVKPGAMIRYLGPTHTYPYVSYYQVLNGDKSIPPDFFKDQIVLIGRDVRATPEAGAANADTFSTPFLNYEKWLTPGVEIHATLIENVINQQTITPAGRETVALLLTIAVLLSAAGLVRWHPLYGGLYFLALLGMMGGLSWWLFGHHNYWLPVSSAMAALASIYVGMAMISYFLEKRRGREIKTAFSRYVSAQVVEDMIAHPEKLTLGGERREMTLLFCDLAGFTSISEKLPPDVVAKLINAYLTAMTNIIMKNGGTVDKFIGDAVMAFWGAPLQDEEHALHASQSATEMQVALNDLKKVFIEHGVANLAMRIGVHSGIAVVGNMGSEARFDYTAMGDTVNLASRLEGVNKLYGTNILISADTASRLNGRLLLRRVDKVRVKGKQESVEIFTPSNDETLNALTLKAAAEYAARNWDTSVKAWEEILSFYPGDGVARVHLTRIADFRSEAPPDGWDGSVALEKF